jgi:hypothetical protein
MITRRSGVDRRRVREATKTTEPLLGTWERRLALFTARPSALDAIYPGEEDRRVLDLIARLAA